MKRLGMFTRRGSSTLVAAALAATLFGMSCAEDPGESCSAGEAGCECVEGACVQGLECVDGMCSDPGSGDGDGDGGTSGDGDGDGTGDGDGDGDGVGDTCSTNQDCASLVCEVFVDVPPDDGSCADASPDGYTRAMGTVRDLATGVSVSGATVDLKNVVSIAANPTQAESLASATSDGDGRFDMLTTTVLGDAHPLGVATVINAPGHYQTIVAVLQQEDGGEYRPACDVHDVWLVGESQRTQWNAMLEEDSDLIGYIPLGDLGGMVGMARDAQTGSPLSGVVLEPQQDTSSAKLRYLNEAGTAFDGNETASSGIFVLFGSATGEDFDVIRDGEATGSTFAGFSTGGAVGVVAVDLE